MKRKLTPKQQRFVDAYAGNATDAARLAGYKGNDNTLSSIGEQNLRKLDIAEAIAIREKTRAKVNILNRESRQIFWSDTVRDEETDIKDRLRASELLGKSEGDFLDRKEVTGRDGGAIETRSTVIQEILESVNGATRGLPN